MYDHKFIKFYHVGYSGCHRHNNIWAALPPNLVYISLEQDCWKETEHTLGRS